MNSKLGKLINMLSIRNRSHQDLPVFLDFKKIEILRPQPNKRRQISFFQDFSVIILH